MCGLCCTTWRKTKLGRVWPPPFHRGGLGSLVRGRRIWRGLWCPDHPPGRHWGNGPFETPGLESRALALLSLASIWTGIMLAFCNIISKHFWLCVVENFVALWLVVIEQVCEWFIHNYDIHKDKYVNLLIGNFLILLRVGYFWSTPFCDSWPPQRIPWWKSNWAQTNVKTENFSSGLYSERYIIFQFWKCYKTFFKHLQRQD